MATILLPPLRRRGVNLYPYFSAGKVYAGTNATLNTPPGDRVMAAANGLVPGDVISGSAEIQNIVSGENTRLELRAFDVNSNILATVTSTYANNTSFTRHECGPLTLPASTHVVYLFIRRESGSGQIRFKKAMINRGTPAPHEWPKRGAWAPITHGQLVRDNEQFVQRSEEHTSELQSRENLVCRLLLEKKKAERDNA